MSVNLLTPLWKYCERRNGPKGRSWKCKSSLYKVIDEALIQGLKPIVCTFLEKVLDLAKGQNINWQKHSESKKGLML